MSRDPAMDDDDGTVLVPGVLDGTDCELRVCSFSWTVLRVVLGEFELDAELFALGVRDRLQAQANAEMTKARELAEDFA